MNNVINKSLKTEAVKGENNKRNIIIISLGIAIVAVLIYFVYSHISHPDTYAELEPMMDEARNFEMQAAEYSDAYSSIEDQVGEDAYFSAIEEGYEDSTVRQQEIIDMIAETDKKIQAAGGITNYEELQRVKIPATDRAAAIAVAEQFDQNYSNDEMNNVPIQEPMEAIAMHDHDHSNEVLISAAPKSPVETLHDHDH